MRTAPGQIWRTLRFRLAAWNAAVVILTAIVTFVALRQGVRRALLHELDQVLIDDAREIALAVASSSEEGAAELYEGLLRKSRGHLHRGWYVKLLDEQRNQIWATPEAGPAHAPPLTIKPLSPISFGGYRIVYDTLARPVHGIHSIRVGANLRFVEQDVARIDRGVTMAAGAVLIAAPLCGYWLAARAARTIGAIITTASRLRPSHLDERLPIHGAGDELDQLAHTVNGLLDRIAAYLNTKRDFLANAAHELRTPLAAIRSSVEVALNGDRSYEEYEDLLVDVIDECGALETLVNQLLLLAETEADLPAAKFELVELQALVTKAVDMFSGVAEAGGVSLRLKAIDRACVYGNPQHLRQVVNNLIDNSVKYTPSGGQISVELAADAARGRVDLKVADTGPGIPQVEQRHIFERFYRAESARSRGAGPRGTGLGLSICQSVVHTHGGAIECRSEQGRGACFIVTLPLATPSDAADLGKVVAVNQ
ncbi:MAG: HAMP domain-containing histidine kinase [Pirellulales bacterium]|nr:HAMP domain-containing histidine kinase [Pirellulales bacterium]